jgi:O-methyltransferase
MSIRSLSYLVEEWRFRKIATKYQPWSMIPKSTFIDNLRLARQIENIPGAVVECGTWRGGMIAGIADVLGNSRRYFLFDSFEGLPPASEIDGKSALAWQANTSDPAYFDNCRASEDDAKEAMSKSPATDYRIVRGWFDATLPGMDSREKIALLRMDADWYDSTKCILDNLADRVVPGGIIIVDDYYAWEGCTRALNEAAALRTWKIRESRSKGICFIIV